jgi:bifunctional non-homologous end joining protein LigD
MRAIISLANASVIASVLTMSSSSGYAITFFVGHCCSVCLVSAHLRHRFLPVNLICSMLTKELSASERVQPTFIEPMQVAPVRDLPDGGAWSYEAKLDGYRCLAAKRNGKAVLWSRRGNGFTDRFPEIARACENLPADTMVDGEVIAIGSDGKVSFNALQHNRSNGHLQLYVFDVLIHHGRKVTGLPLETRRELLADALNKVQYPVIKSTAFDVKPADLIKAAKELELEGVIAKRRGSLYEAGRRSGAWLKYKINRSQEFVIGGYTVGIDPFDALIVGCYDEGKLRYISRVKAGFNPPLRRELYAFLRVLETHQCPFTNLPEARRYRWDVGLTAADMENCRWLRPKLVAQIEFNEWTPDGHLRHSSFAGLRDDKDPRRVKRE